MGDVHLPDIQCLISLTNRQQKAQRVCSAIPSGVQLSNAPFRNPLFARAATDPQDEKKRSKSRREAKHICEQIPRDLRHERTPRSHRYHRQSTRPVMEQASDGEPVGIGPETQQMTMPSAALFDARENKHSDEETDNWDADALCSFKSGGDHGGRTSLIAKRSASDQCQPHNHLHAPRRHVRPSDRRLAEIADHVTRRINWDVLRSSVALWDKKRRAPNDHAFAVYTRKGRDAHYLMATGVVACSLVEIRSILRTTTDKQYASTMAELYGDRYIYGSIVHSAHSNAMKKTNSAASMRFRSRHSNSCTPSSVGTMPPSDKNDCDLLVKTATFTKPHVFARNEQWCFLEHFQPQGDDTPDADDDKRGFVLVMHSLDPDDVFAGKTKASVNQLQEMTAAYSVALAESTSRRIGVRVSFYAQIAVAQKQGNGTRESRMVMSQVKGAASKSTVTSRLTQMAKATSRLPMIVRRRRLGAQVYADHKSIIPTNTRCICCTKSLHLLTKKRKCHLCGYFVCERCSITHTMPRSRLKKFVVRVCEHCMERVDDANYDHIPPEGASPPRIKPNDPNSSPVGVSMTELLRESLEKAPESRKQAVKEVIKYLVDDDDMDATTDSSPSLYAADPPMCLSDESDQSDYIKALETHLRIKETPIKKIKLANAKTRSYPVTYESGKDAVPQYPVPQNEQHRLDLIRQRRLTEIKHVPELEIICSIASQELSCSGAMVTVMDKDMMHVLAATENCDTETAPREHVICSHAIMSGRPMLLPHPEADINFSRMSAVKSGTHFYFGFPLKTEDDTVIGSVCVFDEQHRDITQAQYALLERLANTASKYLQARANSCAAQTGFATSV
ncbi:Fyve finger-containing protein, partial [Globisporangium splendens]